MSELLQYIYAQIDPSTGRCINVFTCSYEIPLPDEYILVPVFSYDYEDKYYNKADGKWYYEPEFITEFII